MCSGYNELTGVILAAGMGKRLGCKTNHQPKALVPIVGAPLIDYTIAFFDYLGIKRIAIVGGYRCGELIDYINQFQRDIVIAENPDYKKQNALSALLALKCESIKGDLLISDVDFIRTHGMAQSLAFESEVPVLFVSEQDYNFEPDNLGVNHDSDQSITSMAKGMSDYQAISAGLLYVPKLERIRLIKAMETAVIKHGSQNARLEDGLMEYIHKGLILKAHNIGPPDWVEIDTPSELDLAETFVKENVHRVVMPD